MGRARLLPLPPVLHVLQDIMRRQLVVKQVVALAQAAAVLVII